MSDELDKFVLLYEVNSKDAEKRLAELEKKVNGVNDRAGDALEGFKKFGSGAADELGKVIPGVDAVSNSIKLMSGEFIAAAAAVAILGIGIKSVIDLRDTYERQRQTGMEVGVSGVRMEEYERKFVKTSGGRVGREQVGENVKSFRDLITSAFTDVSGMGRENRIFRKLGINIRNRGGGVRDTNSLLGDVGSKLQKMSPERAQGIAQFLGLSKDFVASLRTMGASVSQVTELSADEVQKRLQSEQTMKQFNASIADMKEKFKEAEMELGVKLLPYLTQIAQVFGNMASLLPNVVDGFGQLYDKIVYYMNPMNLIKENISDFGIQTPDRNANQPTEKWVSDLQKSIDKLDDQTTTASKTADATVKKADEQNSSARQTTDQFGRAINMFVGAVASFANAIDESQAMAAWAGEIGRASGIASVPTAPKGADGVSLGNALPGLPGLPISPDSALPGDIDKRMKPSSIRTGELTSIGPGGESRKKINLRSVQATIAQRLGVPLDQIQMGGINKGDVAWATRQLEAGIVNNMTQSRRQLMMPGLPMSERSKILTEIRRQQQGLGFMKEYSSNVINSAREGGRSITIGERAIVINVNGAQDSNVVAHAVANHLQGHINDIVNNSTSGVKY